MAEQFTVSEQTALQDISEFVMRLTDMQLM
jgi:hypothetical protein